MASSVTFKIEGFKELDAKLKQLEYEVARKIAFAMTAAGARVIRNDAKVKAPVSDASHTVYLQAGDRGAAHGVLVQPGNLRENIVVKKVSKTKLAAEHIVTVRGKKKNGYAARYGRLQEFGTVNHPPQPFLRPAFEENLQQAIEAMRKLGAARIAKAVK